MANQSRCLVTSSVAILCDWQNVRGTQAQLQCLMSFACRIGTITFKRVYAHWRHEDSQWEELFDELDFDCFNVPSSKRKRNNVDKKLIAHCRQQILNNPDITTVILLSGDGDFQGLVRDLKAKGKRVIVIAECLKKTSRKLIKLADEFHLLEQLC
jgi:uncharacterized LabA/DUF88 family protein